jgi:hypothetical protein
MASRSRCAATVADLVQNRTVKIMRLAPTLLACLALLHLIYIGRAAMGIGGAITNHQQNAAVFWLAREFGFFGVSIFAAIDALVIVGCIRSLREKK